MQVMIDHASYDKGRENTRLGRAKEGMAKVEKCRYLCSMLTADWESEIEEIQELPWVRKPWGGGRIEPKVLRFGYEE